MWAAAIFGALQVLGTTYTAVRAYQMGNYNKRVADKQAERQKVLTQSRTDALQRNSRRQIGALRAAQAGSGLFGGGTTFDVLTDQLFENAREISITEYAGVSSASFLKSAGDLSQRQATSQIYGSILAGGSSTSAAFLASD